jgi:ketosteroid isomerase-like protein
VGELLDRAGVDELADRLFGAIAEGDLDTFRGCLDDDLVVWTSFDDREAGYDDVVKLIAWMSGAIGELRYDVVRREVLPDGFLQQHVLRGRGPRGDVIAMPACVVTQLRDGRVARMEEYLDPAPLVRALG